MMIMIKMMIRTAKMVSPQMEITNDCIKRLLNFTLNCIYSLSTLILTKKTAPSIILPIVRREYYLNYPSTIYARARVSISIDGSDVLSNECGKTVI